MAAFLLQGIVCEWEAEIFLREVCINNFPSQDMVSSRASSGCSRRCGQYYSRCLLLFGSILCQISSWKRGRNNKALKECRPLCSSSFPHTLRLTPITNKPKIWKTFKEFVCLSILPVLYLKVSISERFANWLINNWQIMTMIPIIESRTWRDIYVVLLEWRLLNLKTTNVMACKALGQTQRLKINQRA